MKKLLQFVLEFNLDAGTNHKGVKGFIGNCRNREENGKFRTWLGTIIRNRIADYFRKTGRESRVRAKLREINEPEAFEEVFCDDYRERMLTLAMEELKQQVSPEIYETFALCRQGRSDKDVARLLDVKPNTVTVRKRRCVEILNAVIARLNAADPGLDLPPQ